MSKLKDLTGQKFGRLTVLYRLHNYPSKSAYWLCICNCGNLKEIRGIELCDEWLHNFKAFYDWAMENNYKEGLTIDRIDVNDDYKPDNCRWITNKEQQNNRRNTIYLIYNDKKLSISQWSELLHIPQGRLRNRYNRGWSIKEILFGRDIK